MSIARLTQALANQPNIEVLIAFGSVAAGTARPDSDIDVAIQLSAPLGVDEKMRLIETITLATGRPVDLVDLRTVGEPLLGEILTHGQWLRGSTYERYLLMQRHVYAMEDFMPQVEQMLQQRRHAWLGAHE